MCLKYFVEHAPCDHHEYLGSHHCSTVPCNLDEQHFHYIKDRFPVPWSSSLRVNIQDDRGALACNVCATEHSDGLEADGSPVRLYAPTNDFDVKVVRPTEYPLPISVVRAETQDVNDTKGAENEACEYDHDYKSLSDAEEEDSKLAEERCTSMETYGQHGSELTHMYQDLITSKFKNLSDYLAQHHENGLLLAPLELASEANVGEDYLGHPTRRIAYPAAPSNLAKWKGYGSVPALLPVQPSARLLDPTDCHLQLLPVHLLQKGEGHSTPPIPPTHDVASCPTRPLITSSITDPYSGEAAAKRRHRGGRTRRAMSSLQDELPVRSVALAEFVVEKRSG